jgi:hypothetical protein
MQQISVVGNRLPSGQQQQQQQQQPTPPPPPQASLSTVSTESIQLTESKDEQLHFQPIDTAEREWTHPNCNFSQKRTISRVEFARQVVASNLQFVGLIGFNPVSLSPFVSYALSLSSHIFLISN